jgi:CIC family chloride channel protein
VPTSRLMQSSRKLVRNDQLLVSVLAFLVGAAAGAVIIAFREGYVLVQMLSFGDDVEHSHLAAAMLSPWRRLLVPCLGGLAVGLMIRFVMRRKRAQTVADVIAAAAVRGGRMSLKRGLAAALTDCVSIGFGMSVGREGPAVHLGASIGGWVATRLRLTRGLARTLLGCGVAAAVAASFNAPIAGALFANEVVIGSYALGTFGPIVFASIAGTMVSRAHFGPYPAFEIAEYVLRSWWEMPAFAGLGLAAALFAAVFIRGTMKLQERTARIPGPLWVRTTLGGAVLGMIAMAVPEVLGVGYGVTEGALMERLSWGTLATVAVAKTLATVACLGFGLAGGVFSPSLVIGATLGGAYGVLVTTIAPAFSSGAGPYAVVGMGAVAASVLGAPISTVLIIFEMTGNYGLTTAVMLAVVVASAVTRQVAPASYFTATLERRGLNIRKGYRRSLLREVRVRDIMGTEAVVVSPAATLDMLRRALQEAGEAFVVGADGRLLGTATLADLSEVAFDRSFDDVIKAADVVRTRPPVLLPTDDLETVLNAFEASGEPVLAVVDTMTGRRFLGFVREREARIAYDRALDQARGEEARPGA